MINKRSKIFVAGHNGLVGSAIVRKLISKGYNNIYVVDKKEVDLINQEQVFKYIKKIKPAFIFLAAAKVGGILANQKFKAEFIYNNLSIQNNIIHAAYCNGVKDLIFLLKQNKSEKKIQKNYHSAHKYYKALNNYNLCHIENYKPRTF